MQSINDRYKLRKNVVETTLDLILCSKAIADCSFITRTDGINGFASRDFITATSKLTMTIRRGILVCRASHILDELQDFGSVQSPRKNTSDTSRKSSQSLARYIYSADSPIQTLQRLRFLKEHTGNPSDDTYRRISIS